MLRRRRVAKEKAARQTKRGEKKNEMYWQCGAGTRSILFSVERLKDVIERKFITISD
jgi:hypothetical protein